GLAYLGTDLGTDLAARRLDPGGYGRVDGARCGDTAVAALALLDGGDQLALAHPSGAGDTERRGHALQLGKQHRGKAAARTPTTGRARRLLRRLGAGDIRRHVGGVAQWIP